MAACATLCMLLLTACDALTPLSTAFERTRRDAAAGIVGWRLDALAAMSVGGRMDESLLAPVSSPQLAEADVAWLEDLAADRVAFVRPPGIERIVPVRAGGVAGADDIVCLDLDAALLVRADGTQGGAVSYGLASVVVVEFERADRWVIAAMRPATAAEAAWC